MTVAERTRVDGLLLEESHVAIATFGTPWEHRSCGPYRIQRRYTSDPYGELMVWDMASEDVEYAVGMFCEVALPMQREATVLLMDESFRCVLGYTTMWGGIRGVGMAWWGTAETFGVLQTWSDMDPLALAVWESIARGYVQC